MSHIEIYHISCHCILLWKSEEEGNLADIAMIIMTRIAQYFNLIIYQEYMSSHSSYASYRANKNCCSGSGEAGAQGPQGPQGPRGVDSAGSMRMRYGGVKPTPELSTFTFSPLINF